MSTGRIRHAKSQLSSLDLTNTKREVSSHTKKLSFSGHQNVSLAHSSSAQGLCSDQYRYRSTNEVEAGYRNDRENGGIVSSNGFVEDKNLLQLSQAQGKKIFEKVYKMKTLKFRPYINESDTQLKKAISELNFIKKAVPKDNPKKSENSKNSLNFASHNSHRDLLNTSSRKLNLSNNTSQIKENSVLEIDNKANHVASIDLQNALLAKLKDIPSQSQASQRNRIKLSEPPYPSKLTQKMHKKSSMSQLRRIGDLEALKQNLKYHIPMDEKSHMSVEKSVKPVKGHRRGVSMDQGSVSLNKSYSHTNKQNLQIRAAKFSSKAQKSGNNNLHPTQENNPQFQDPKFIEEFFGSSKLKFDFERNVISQINKRKNDINATTLASTTNTRNGTTHYRTRSIEESNLLSLLKSTSRWSSQKISSGEDMPIAPGNSYLQETLNDISNKTGNLMESNY